MVSLREGGKTKSVTVIKKFYNEKELPKELHGTLPYFFIDSDLEDPDKESIETREKILKWASGLPHFNLIELEEKDPNYRKIYYKEDNEIKTTEDTDYVYKETIIYRTKMADDLDGKKIQLGNKEILRTVKHSFPKKESLLGKVVGGIMIDVGVLAAPFSFDATLVGVPGGIATIIASDD